MPNYPAPICEACVHLSSDVDLDVGPTCTAFPAGIPKAIWPEGFDHRNSFDVAVRPDSDEGKALMAYLRRERIPFLAFKGPVPGASTGAHIHIGQVSPRLIPAKAAGR